MSISYEGVAEQVVTMKLDTTGTAAKEGTWYPLPPTTQ